MLFQSYVSNKGLSSRYRNDNSSFPESRGGVGDNFPSPTLFSILPPYLPSFSQHMDAGVPIMFSRCLSSVSALTKTCRFSSSHSLPVFLTHRHTHTWSLLQLTVLLKEHFLGPADFLDIIQKEKNLQSLWTHGLPPLQNACVCYVHTSMHSM